MTATAAGPHEIASVLRDAILAGVYVPGQELLQVDLAKQFGVSRVPLREALRTLAGEGLITFRQGVGATVTSLNADEVDDLFGLRLLIEPCLASQIINNCSDRDISDLLKMIDEMANIPEVTSAKWSRLNFDFHLSMFRLIRRPQTLRVVEQLLYLCEPYTGLYVNFLMVTERRDSQHEHREMVQAMIDREPSRLETSLLMHLEGARRSLTAAMREAAKAEHPMEQLLSIRASRNTHAQDSDANDLQEAASYPEGSN